MKITLRAVFCLAMLWAIEARAVNVAVVAPKVGYLAKFGNELIEGVQIAVDNINQNGGINGEKINLITVDDRCEDSFAVSAAQMMAVNSSKEDKISLVIGPYCSNMFDQVAYTYAQGKIIRVIPTPLDNQQYALDEKGLFKIGGVMSDEAIAFYNFYKRKFADKNVAVVYDSKMFSTSETALRIQTLFQDNNLSNRITLYDFANYGDDYEQMAKEILLNNQIAVVLSNAKSTAKLVQRLQEREAETVVFVDEYLANAYFFREMGNFAEGVYVMRRETLKDSPSFTEELVKLRLQGKEPKGLGVYGYAAVKLWRQLAEKAKSTDFDKIDALKNGNEFVLPWGKVAFVKGNAKENSGYDIYQVQNGEYTQVN